jgi:hypothetical protein
MSDAPMTVEEAADAIGQVEASEDDELDTPELDEGDDRGDDPDLNEDGEEEGEPQEDGEEAEDPEAPRPEPVPAPKSWTKEDAKAFEALPPETQAIVARRENDRDQFVRETARKAGQVRHEVENEARSIIAQQAEAHAQALEAYAQLIVPQAPDVRLLYTNDPNDMLAYQRQDAAYRAGVSQQQQLHQAIAQSQQQAEAARKQTHTAETEADRQRLADELPEWFDETTGPKLRHELQSIGADLGYSPELMSAASSTDILALKQAAEWKAKADKFDALNKGKMAAVRAAKGLPKMGKPGTVQGKGQQAKADSSKFSDALSQFRQDRSPEAAAALLGSRNR